MSPSDDIIISILDQEIPDSYKEIINSQVSSNPNMQEELRKHKYIKEMIQNEARSDKYDKASSSLRTRLFASISISKGQFYRPQIWQGFLQFIPAFSALLLAFALVLIASNRSVPFISPTPISDYTRYQLLDFVTPINTLESNASEDRNFNQAGESDSQLRTNSQGESIDLQINVSDMEQLFYLLEKTRSVNGSINSLTIQLPEINTFEILGESQLRPLEEDF